MSCNPLAPHHKPYWSGENNTIVFAENKVKYEVSNTHKREFSYYRTDEDKVIGDKRACDYLLIRCEDKHAFFIELKGRHLLDAIDQISSSVDHLKLHLKDHVLHARIIVSKTYQPDILHSKYLKLERLLRQTGGDIIPKTKYLKENL